MEQYDVVVIGGAISGGSTALLLRRENPDLRVLIVEKLEQFDEKVGEATTEMSGMFLTRRLALWHHLELEHLPKEGLRYWFHNDRVEGHRNASETGAVWRSVVPSFQLRRDVLDEYVLKLAVDEGAEIARPARVGEVVLREFDNEITIVEGDQKRTVSARWIVDASGRVNLLGRKLGLIEKNEHHPTAAAWGRWKGVRHIDDIAARGPIELARKNVGSRRLGTNHYTGYGYWIWVIPLGNGETSIGVVWDRRLVDLHEKPNREAAYRSFLLARPDLAELLEGAELRSEDFRYFGQLAYATKQYAGRGWALVGDAAVFLDPYYSPGLDHVGFSVEATVEMILQDARGECVAARLEEHNETFLRSYWRFFESVYRDKYRYMGEHDLLSAAMLIETGMYYIFVVIPAYNYFGRFHWMPVLGPKPAAISYWIMKTCRRRFAAIAEMRRRLGIDRERNDGRRMNLYFNLSLAPLRMVGRGLRVWLRAELALIGARMRRAGMTRRSDDARAATENTAAQ